MDLHLMELIWVAEQAVLTENAMPAADGAAAVEPTTIEVVDRVDRVFGVGYKEAPLHLILGHHQMVFPVMVVHLVVLLGLTMLVARVLVILDGLLFFGN